MGSFKIYSTKLISHMQNDNDDVHEAGKAILLLFLFYFAHDRLTKTIAGFYSNDIVSDTGSSI